MGEVSGWSFWFSDTQRADYALWDRRIPPIVAPGICCAEEWTVWSLGNVFPEKFWQFSFDIIILIYEGLGKAHITSEAGDCWIFFLGFLWKRWGQLAKKSGYDGGVWVRKRKCFHSPEMVFFSSFSSAGNHPSHWVWDGVTGNPNNTNGSWSNVKYRGFMGDEFKRCIGGVWEDTQLIISEVATDQRTQTSTLTTSEMEVLMNDPH